MPTCEAHVLFMKHPLCATVLLLVLTMAGQVHAEASAVELYQAGQIELDQNDWTGAAKKFEHAIEVQKNYSEAYDKLGLALYNQGKINDAITQFTQAAFLNPRFTEALYHVGMGYEFQHNDLAMRDDEKTLKKLLKSQYKKAIDWYSKAVNVAPENDMPAVARSHFRLGVIKRDLELKKSGKDGAKPNMKPAMDHLEKAVALIPDFPEAHNELGRVYDIIGRYPEAIDQFTLAIQGHKFFASAFSNRGVARWHDGNWDLALADCRKAVEIDRNFAGGRFNLGQVVFARVQELKANQDRAVVHLEVQKAIDEFTAAITIDSKFKDAWHALAKAQWAYHDYESAKKTYEKILFDNKKDKEAKKAMKALAKEEKIFKAHVPKQYLQGEAPKK